MCDPGSDWDLTRGGSAQPATNRKRFVLNRKHPWIGLDRLVRRMQTKPYDRQPYRLPGCAEV